MTGRDKYGLEVGLPVEVLADGEWWPGEIRGRRRRETGEWVADVAYSRGPGMNYVATVTYDRLRLPHPAPPPDKPDGTPPHPQRG